MVLPSGALVDARTRSELGDQALDEVLAGLWPGDCQSCGNSLGAAAPALAIDDLQVITRASLHHPACRPPQWNDSWTITAPSTGLVTWRTVVLLLPFQQGNQVIRPAGLLVNPGLEELWLARAPDGWHPCLEPSFAAAGLTPPSAGMPIRMPASGVAGRVDQTALTASVEGRTEIYGSEAEPQIRAAATELEGFLLIVTHAADPAQISPGRVMYALASPLTLVGWAGMRSAR